MNAVSNADRKFHTLPAVLIAPWTVVAVLLLVTFIEFGVFGGLIGSIPNTIGFAICAYLATIIFGLPPYFALRRIPTAGRALTTMYGAFVGLVLGMLIIGWADLGPGRMLWVWGLGFIIAGGMNGRVFWIVATRDRDDEAPEMPGKI
jgi:hypothetical protein